MDFVSAWLKGIILIILFATFMDLLLPSSSMQKYVKLVIGLIIIITMLTPLLVVLNGTEAFTGNDFLDWQRGDAIVASAIEEVSQRIEQNQQEMTSETAKQMVKNAIQNILHLQGEYALVELELQTNGEQTIEQIEISKLNLILRRLEDNIDSELEHGGAQSNIEAIVTEVSLIQIETIQINEQNSEAERQSMSEFDTQSVKEVKQILSKHLEVPSKNITIRIVEEG